jgi:hypothetical protein
VRPFLADGTLYQRRRAVQWDFVRSVLRFRQDERDALRAGFIRVRAFAELPWESPNVGWCVVDTRINRDGTALYAKVAPR